MADTATVPVDAGNKKVERPDEAKFKAELAEREKAHKQLKAEFVSLWSCCATIDW